MSTDTITSLHTLQLTTPLGTWDGSFFYTATEHPVERGQERPRVPAGRLYGKVAVNGVAFDIEIEVEYSAVLAWDPTGGEDGGGAYKSTGDGWHMRRTGYISTRRIDGGKTDVSSTAKNKVIDAAIAALNERDLEARIAATHGAITNHELEIKGLQHNVEELQAKIEEVLNRKGEFASQLATLHLGSMH